MSLHQIRYIIEHRIIPCYFYEQKEQFIGFLLRDRENFYRLVDDIFQAEQIPNPYSGNSFTTESAKLQEDLFMVKLIYPEPEEAPLCYCAYLFFDSLFKHPGFFTVEKGNALSQDRPFICSWTPDGNHNNYGNCTLEDGEDFLHCLKFYNKRSS